MPDVKLKQWNGEEKVFSGAETITVPTESGGSEVFTHGELAEDITAGANFANGDMVLSPGDGKMVKNVTVNKPATLIPENIAEGVDIAGIVGTLAAGGNVVFASGSVSGFSSSDREITVQHNLGVVPDIVIFLTKSKITATNLCLQQCVGFSKAFYEKTGSLISGFFTAMKLYSSSASTYTYSVSTNTSNNASCIDVGTAASARVKNADESSFTVLNGSNGWYLDPSLTYYWYAIGGLT